jgi:toxin ParE1/3/4
MPFKVFLTDDAVRDLEQVYDYIEHHDAPSRAEYVLGKIEKAFLSLSENPNRGPIPESCRPWGSRNTGKYFSSLIALFIGLRGAERMSS